MPSAVVLPQSEAVSWPPASFCAIPPPAKPRTTTGTRRSAFPRSSRPPPVSVGRPAHSSPILCTPCGAVRRQPKPEGGSSQRGLGRRLDHGRPFSRGGTLASVLALPRKGLVSASRLVHREDSALGSLQCDWPAGSVYQPISGAVLRSLSSPRRTLDQSGAENW